MNKYKLARIISEISNGFLTMILTPILGILSSPIKLSQKVGFSVAYFLATTLPFLILKKMGRISDYEFTDRRERPPYFISISILYGLFYLFLKNFQLPILSDISLALFLVSTVISFITLFWKISGHMTFSTLLFCTLAYLYSPLFFLLFLFSPFIGWSRIVLKKHNIAQVIAGTLVPFVICILIYWVF
jgi:membrane-associated phospholipid phosphatase